jgi:hypothetical protein
MIKIYDNIFDKEYLYSIDRRIHSIPCSANNIANRKTIPYGNTGTHRLLGSTMFHRTSINNINYCDHNNFPVFFELFKLIEDELNVNFLLWTCKVNLQHSGCNGTIHTDASKNTKEGKYSLMLFTNADWEKEWGGEFEINNEKIDYVPGRLILFDGSIPHRGLGPNMNNPYIYRTSLIYVVDYFDEWIELNAKNMTSDSKKFLSYI